MSEFSTILWVGNCVKELIDLILHERQKSMNIHITPYLSLFTRKASYHNHGCFEKICSKNALIGRQCKNFICVSYRVKSEIARDMLVKFYYDIKPKYTFEMQTPFIRISSL